MKKSNFLVSVFFLTVLAVFTSCEKSEALSEETPEELGQAEIFDEIEANLDKTTSSSKSISDVKVYRYYQGGSATVHTYRTQSGSGIAYGSYEGVAFTTPVSFSSTGYDTSKYNVLYFLIHPNYQDFVMTTSATEFWNLRRSGWSNVTRNYVLIAKGAGSGLSKLYRFYGNQNSDHLFTKSYSEGINAGYTYEGVVGYVK
ncbi:hypothetical protein [Aquimarina pacifica]|uniref:hypothetical protein n=1 Tax=Aquimarina pacifica TaxID=1296415 RepID=UPI0004700418|nr:hypothetical protein [Aquimarina pacifica]